MQETVGVPVAQWDCGQRSAQGTSCRWRDTSPRRHHHPCTQKEPGTSSRAAIAAFGYTVVRSRPEGHMQTQEDFRHRGGHWRLMMQKGIKGGTLWRATLQELEPSLGATTLLCTRIGGERATVRRVNFLLGRMIVRTLFMREMSGPVTTPLKIGRLRM